MTAPVLAYLFTVDGPVADGRGGRLTACPLIDRFLLVEDPAGMSALGQNRSFLPGRPNVCFAPIADIGDRPQGPVA